MSTPESRALSPFISAPVVAAPSSVSGQALAVRESTRMQSAMLLARTYPRDEEVAERAIIRACGRLALAEEALYKYAKGGTDIEGASIRLAEEMGRCWGGIFCGVEETRGATSSEWRTFAWDLQALWGDEKLFTVKHWVDTRDGGRPTRDEREIYELGANQAARRKRANILACIPQYIQDAAIAEVKKTLAAHIDTSPARIATMLDAFKAYNVTQEMIERKIQCKLEAITPASMVLLRNVYNALRDGIAKTADHFSAPDADATGKSQTDRVKETLRGRQAGTEGGDSKKARKGASTPAGEGQAELMPGDTVPFFSQASAIAALKACATSAALAVLWAEITRDFRESSRALPIEIEAYYNERLEVLDASST